MLASHKGIASTPKAIDFSKQQVTHNIYSNSFFPKGFSMASIKLFLRKYKSMEIGKHTQAGT
jgi:hypothetical protein